MGVLNCLVDENKYDIGCLVPAIFIIAILSFMRKRVRLKPNWWNGRPGLPVAVDFLGDERNRFIIPFAFGATAASSLNAFLGISAASRELQQSAWSRAFQGIFMILLYGINNYPYLACLNAEYKIIGYTLGLLYSLGRFIADLFMYFGCTIEDEKLKHAFEKLNLEYLLYIDILVNIPVVFCTFILVASYSMLLYKEIKKPYVQGPLSLRYMLQKEETGNINLAGETERAHVKLLFSNQLHQTKERAPNQHKTWYNSLKNWIYVTRPDFKFSTQFLSSFVVSCLFVYQFTALLLMYLFTGKTIQSKLEGMTSGLEKKVYQLLLLSEDYIIASVVIACLFAIMQLCFFLRSHRNDVLKTYRTREGLLPDEIPRPKMLVGKSLRFCGYQIAFTTIGLFTNALSAFFLLSPMFTFQLLSIFKTNDEILHLIEQFISWILLFYRYGDHLELYCFKPLIVASIFLRISMILLSRSVFSDHTYLDISITIDNRRMFGIMSYFFFFFNILVGLWSGLFRIVKGAVLGSVFLPRVDRTTMMKGYRRFDRAYMAYIGFLSVLVAFKHPVMLCFCQLLLEGVRRRETGPTTVTNRPLVSTRALNHWFLAVQLTRNPRLVRDRKQGVHPGSLLSVMRFFRLLLSEVVRRRKTGPTTVTNRPRVSTRALNRWFLAVRLMRNPSLVRDRKQGVHPGVPLSFTNDVQLEMSAIKLEEDSPQQST